MSYLCQKCKKKKWGVTDFVLEITHLKGHPNFEKSVLLTQYGSNVCMSKNNANESLEQNFLCQFYMSGSVKQIKTTGNVSLSKLNLQTTEFADPDSRKLAEFDAAWVEKWENF